MAQQQNKAPTKSLVTFDEAREAIAGFYKDMLAGALHIKRNMDAEGKNFLHDLYSELGYNTYNAQTMRLHANDMIMKLSQQLILVLDTHDVADAVQKATANAYIKNYAENTKTLLQSIADLPSHKDNLFMVDAVSTLALAYLQDPKATETTEESLLRMYHEQIVLHTTRLNELTSLRQNAIASNTPMIFVDERIENHRKIITDYQDKIELIKGAE